MAWGVGGDAMRTPTGDMGLEQGREESRRRAPPISASYETGPERRI